MRHERLFIKMSLDKAAAERHPLAVRAFKPNMLMADGDTLKLAYAVNIEYFGQVVEHLIAVTELCSDPDIVHSAETEELIHGQSIVQEFFEVWHNLQSVLGK